MNTFSRTLPQTALTIGVLASVPGCGPTLSQTLASLAAQQESAWGARIEQYYSRYQAFLQGLSPEQGRLYFRATALQNDQAQLDFVNSLRLEQEGEYLWLVEEKRVLDQQRDKILALLNSAVRTRWAEQDAAWQALQQFQRDQQQRQILWNQQRQEQQLQQLNSQIQMQQFKQELQQQGALPW